MMKTLKYLLIGAAGLMMAACSQDFEPGSNGPEASITVNLTTPQLGTRYGDGTSATALQYAIYEVTASGNEYLETYTTTDETISMSKQINFQLVKGKKYGLVFWAAAPDAPYTVTFSEEGAQMEINTTNLVANSDNLDAFYAYYELIVNGDQEVTIPLYRPFAQINFGTNDLEAAGAANLVPTSSRIIALSTYKQLDLISGDVVGDPAQITFKYGVLQPDQAFPVEGYDYLSMAYVLVPQTQTLLTQVRCNYGTAGVVYPNVDVRNVPVQRNYRTNLYGSILTNNIVTNIVIEPNFDNPDYNNPLALAAMNGGFTLQQNESILGDVTFTGTGVANLNGFTITTGPEGSMCGSIVSRGTSANVTVNGPGGITSTGTTGPLVVENGGTMTITGGTFNAQNHSETVYIAGAGTVYITGGYFSAGTLYNEKSFVLNCLDANAQNGSAKFVVTGGTFEGFNPAASEADFTVDKQPFNWVPEGYKSTETLINGKQCWVVTAEDTEVTDNYQDAFQALKDGKDVTLTSDLDVTPVKGNGYGTQYGVFKVTGSTFNGNGNTVNSAPISGESDTNACMLYSTGGTIENVTFTNTSKSLFKCILVEGLSSDLYLNNVNVPSDSKFAYGINMSVGKNYAVYANNSTFTGWCSWGTGFSTVNFTGCNFSIGTYYASGSLYNGLVKPYNTTVFENCSFDENIYMDLSALAPGQIITFKNCTVNGQVLTEANHKIMKGYLKDSSLTDWENYENVKSQVRFMN